MRQAYRELSVVLIHGDASSGQPEATRSKPTYQVVLVVEHLYGLGLVLELLQCRAPATCPAARGVRVDALPTKLPPQERRCLLHHLSHQHNRKVIKPLGVDGSVCV